MLEFINNNGVLFSGLFSIIVALISVIVSILKEKRASRLDTVQSLRKQLKATQDDLEETRKRLDLALSVDNAEKRIDKTHGAIYYEALPNGGTRAICGYCWEKEHIKIPIVVDLCYEEYTRQQYYDGFCQVCKSHCIENIDSNDECSAGVSIDDDLPF